MTSIKSRLKDYLNAKGIEPNQSGFIKCLWHEDEKPSCKLNPDYLYCFSCTESGDIFKASAALNNIPYSRENFRKIAEDVERTLGLPEFKPQRTKYAPGFKLSESAMYRCELLRDFAEAVNGSDLNRAHWIATVLFGLYLLPDKKEAA